MKLLYKLKKQKRITAVIVIAILAGVIELICNYHALVEGYEMLDLTPNIRVEGEGGNEEYVVVYESEDEIYLKQIKLTGTFQGQRSYTVKTTEVNSFEKEEDQTYRDTVNDWFPAFYTDINKKVTSVEIRLAKNEEEELTSVSFSNQFEINKYRVLFWLIVLSLFYCIFFEKMFLEKIEWYFLIYAFAFGLLTIICTQPQRASWDEQIHFGNAYKIACGKNIEWSEAAYNLANSITVSCNTKAEYAELRNYMDAMGESIVLTETKETLVVSHGSLAYIPMALFLKVGMLFHFPFSILFEFGKIGNLFVYVLIMFWAIRLAKFKKLFLLFLSMMPTVLFQASSYTYDGVVFSFITLGCVLWSNMAFHPEEKLNVKQMTGAVFCFTVGCFSKAVYIPVILLMILLPAFKRQKRAMYAIYIVAILAVFALIVMTFVLPTVTNTVAGNLSYGGDSRGGDTGSVRQLLSMVKHPWASIKLMFGNIIALDNFRNLGSVGTDSYNFINLMFLNFALLGILPDKWCVALVPVLLLLLFYNDEEEARLRKYPRTYRWAMLMIIFMVIGLIWMAMYLSFTPVGDEQIAGVQARYYLPLIYLGALLIKNNIIEIKVDDVVVRKITLIMALIFEAAAFYHVMLKTRLF